MITIIVGNEIVSIWCSQFDLLHQTTRINGKERQTPPSRGGLILIYIPNDKERH